MQVEVEVTVDGTKAAVWDVISNIENAVEVISGIDQIEVLEKPAEGLLGLKWRETRTLFGKTAVEVMWVTEVVDGQHYKAQAESHGSVYVSTMGVSGEDGQCRLTMTHETRPQTLLAKIMCYGMGFAFKGLMRKAVMKDLVDIKTRVEC